AVMAVVIFHLWPQGLTGGYVGVDVFFGISGYLITAHLLREVEAQGAVDLRAFWARRIRRLLPAAALVLAVTLAATLLFSPSRLWTETAKQIGASAIGAENWVLAAGAVDYFGQNNVPSAVQHYWSLSLEEQFYVVWPILLSVVALIAVRTGLNRHRALVMTMSAAVALSLAWSVYSTATSPAAAYFSTFAHGWEFALGGLVALVLPHLMAGRWGAAARARGAVTVAGLAAIIVSAVIFTGASPFPGWIALLPIAGTMAVIAAGSGSAVARVLAVRPVQFVGDVSYSTYLWHWPIIVILPHALGHELGTVSKLGVLVASVALGWLTKVLVEDPVRKAPSIVRRKLLTYGLAVVTASVLVGASTLAWQAGMARAAQDQAAAASAIEAALDGGNPCFGAAAMAAGDDCRTQHDVDPRFGPDFAADDWGSIAGVTKDGTLPDKSACTPLAGNDGFLDCRLGAAAGTTTLAIVGDSHALAMTEPLVRIAQANGWSVRAFLFNSCTPSLPMQYEGGVKADCNAWRAAVADRVEDDPDINLVVTTGFTRGEPEAAFSGTRDDLVGDYADLWTRWADAGKRVLVLEDVPLTTGESVPECVAAHLAEDDPCAVPRATALAWDPVVDAVDAADDPAISLVDTTDAFCDATTCHAVIGGLIAYRDPHHLSATFALTLVPRLEAAFRAAGY
ncbi:MAG: acyltransferase, partial [Actinobacteria bacterium]|nr:acyltransferase [Actinomycetota bacterium]